MCPSTDAPPEWRRRLMTFLHFRAVARMQAAWAARAAPSAAAARSPRSPNRRPCRRSGRPHNHKGSLVGRACGSRFESGPRSTASACTIGQSARASCNAAAARTAVREGLREVEDHSGGDGRPWTAFSLVAARAIIHPARVRVAVRGTQEHALILVALSATVLLAARRAVHFAARPFRAPALARAARANRYVRARRCRDWRCRGWRREGHHVHSVVRHGRGRHAARPDGRRAGFTAARQVQIHLPSKEISTVPDTYLTQRTLRAPARTPPA